MSEVKRYGFWPQIVHLPGGGGVRAEVNFKVEEDGLFVAHQDYARLKAEVEAHEKRWAESEDLISHYKQQRDEAYNDCQCHRLKAEVERLRKAGDAMCKFFDDHGFYGFGFQEAWNAAKEGKPSV